MIVFIWLVILVVAFALYLRKVYSRFDKYNVRYLKPIPILGNSAPLITRKMHISEFFQQLYNEFPNDRFVGRFDTMNAVIIPRDLELIKKITIKDFEHFIDHRSMVDDSVDPFFGRNLFSLRGQEWKDMRSTLSPAFTSSKMKHMVPFMVEVNDQMLTILKKHLKESKTGYLDLESKDLTTRYANDVIASCAFGVRVDSHTNLDNEFYKMGDMVANMGFRRVLIFLGYLTVPALMKRMNIKLIREEPSTFFKELVLGTMKDRDLRHIHRPDMIHLLMEAKKGKLTYDEKMTNEADTGFSTVEESDIGKRIVNRDWSNNDLVAQAILFFIAGFETVSSTMSFTLHELALHPDVQEKLYEEIKENSQRNNGKFDYTSIQNLVYMDMVISEVLRLWPPAVGLDRLCVKDYNLGRANKDAKHDYIIRKGESLMVPVFSIHHDVQYFPNPYKFDPERFSDENKHNIKPFTYMPFGSGPRNCIGSRFALCEVKVMLYQFLQAFEVTPCEKTCIPTKLQTDTFNLRIQGGHWIRIKERK